MLAAADAGQSVVAAILGLGAAGVAGGVIAMTWSLHVHQIQCAARLAGREASEPAVSGPAEWEPADGEPADGEPADSTLPAYAMNGNAIPAKAAKGSGAPRPPGGAPGTARAGEERGHRPGPAPGSAIEGPDSVVIGEQARYRVRRSATQQVVAWAAGGGAVSQASDPAHPEDLLLVADRPGNLTVSVRLREGLAERREIKTVTAVANPATAVPALTSRLLLQDWPLITVAVLVAGFAASLVALGSLAPGDFIALVTPLTALLAVVLITRGTPGGPRGPGGPSH